MPKGFSDLHVWNWRCLSSKRLVMTVMILVIKMIVVVIVGGGRYCLQKHVKVANKSE